MFLAAFGLDGLRVRGTQRVALHRKNWNMGSRPWVAFRVRLREGTFVSRVRGIFFTFDRETISAFASRDSLFSFSISSSDRMTHQAFILRYEDPEPYTCTQV